MFTAYRLAGAAADALQAERWHDRLVQERSDLALELANRRIHLEQCAVDSLARRFPDAIATLQRA
jgi:hypothetical protein